MNKKMIIGLTLAGVAVVGVVAITTGVILGSKNNDVETPKDPVNKPTLGIKETKQTEATLTLKNLTEYKNQTLQVYVKVKTAASYPTNATKTVTVNDKGELLEIALSNLTEATTYSVKVTTTATDGKAAVDVATFETITTQPKNETPPPPTPENPTVQPVSTVASVATNKATVNFAGLDNYVGKKVFVSYKEVNNAAATDNKTTEVTVPASKTLDVEITSLASNTTYTYSLVVAAVEAVAATDTTPAVDAVAQTVIYTSPEAKYIKTYAEPTVEATPSATGMAVKVIGLQDYEGQTLVVTWYKKLPPVTVTSGVAPADPVTAAPVNPEVAAFTGVVKDNVLELTLKNNLTPSSDYELVVTENITGKNVVVKQAVSTLAPMKVEAGTIGPESVGLKFKDVTPYKGKKIIVKYASPSVSETADEALAKDGTRTYEFEIPADLSETEIAKFISGLQPNTDYVFQAYLKDVPDSPLLTTPFKVTTTGYAELEVVASPQTNPRLYKGGVELKFSKLASWKDKKLDLVIVKKGQTFVTTAEGYSKTTSSSAVTESDGGKLTFNVTGLDSETEYTYQLYVEGEEQNLLANTGMFTSVKAAEATLKEVTDQKIVVQVSNLSDYFGKTIKLQFRDSTAAADAAWSDHSTTVAVTLENKDSVLFELTSVQLSDTTKSYKYKIVEFAAASGSEEVVPEQTILLKLPVVSKTSTTSKFTVTAKSLDSLVGKTLVLQYKKKDATEWVTAEEKEVTDSNKLTESFASVLPLNSEETFTYQLMVKDSYVVKTEDVTTLATPVAGTKDVTGTSVTFTIQNLSDYVGRTIKLYYRKKSDSTWSDSSTTVTVTEENKTTQQSVTESSLEAKTEYEYYFFMAKLSTDASTEDVRLQKQIVETLEATAAAATVVPSATETGGDTSLPGSPDASGTGGSLSTEAPAITPGSTGSETPPPAS